MNEGASELKVRFYLCLTCESFSGIPVSITVNLSLAQRTVKLLYLFMYVEGCAMQLTAALKLTKNNNHKNNLEKFKKITLFWNVCYVVQL